MKTIKLGNASIICPECRKAISLNDTLAAALLADARKQYSRQLANKEVEAVARLKTERLKVAKQEAQKAKRAMASFLRSKDKKLYDLERALISNTAKLRAAQKAEAALLRKTEAIESTKRKMGSIVQKKLQQSLEKISREARDEAETGLRAQLSEKETQLSSMTIQIENLRRKSLQGSQQLQGQAFELELEAMLRARFVADVIERSPVGVSGGDILQQVRNSNGRLCGRILWEAKRTRVWRDAWLLKARADQEAAKADIVILVSQTLPKSIETFEFHNGIWITAPRYATALAAALRLTIMEISKSKRAAVGQRSKLEEVYHYLIGPGFRSRINSIVEKFMEMQTDLHNERNALIRLWAKRETQLREVLDSSIGLYGDLQGLAGSDISEIAGVNFSLSLHEVPGEKYQLASTPNQASSTGQ